jgi:acetyl-CoA carboxylase, biotin carboxylase subunit
VLLQPSGPGIRRDSGMYEGWTVPMDYDPLLAKLVGYGTRPSSRPSCRLHAGAQRILRRRGSRPTSRLFRRILGDPDFRAAKLDTGFLDRLLKRKQAEAPADPKAIAVAAIAAGIFTVLGAAGAGAGERPANGSANDRPKTVSNWTVAARKEATR